MIEGKIEITISARRQDDDLVIKVKDNGIGMKKEQLDQLLSYKKNGGYGFYNINARMRLRYSQTKYGISCTSEYGKGTEVTLLFPFIAEYGVK